MKTKIRKAVTSLRHPEIDASLSELRMIDHLEIEGEKITLTLKLPFKYVPIRDLLVKMIEEVVRGVSPSSDLKIEIAEMNENEREKFMRISRERWLGLPSEG